MDPAASHSGCCIFKTAAGCHSSSAFKGTSHCFCALITYKSALLQAPETVCMSKFQRKSTFLWPDFPKMIYRTKHLGGSGIDQLGPWQSCASRFPVRLAATAAAAHQGLQPIASFALIGKAYNHLLLLSFYSRECSAFAKLSARKAGQGGCALQSLEILKI